MAIMSEELIKRLNEIDARLDAIEVELDKLLEALEEDEDAPQPDAI